jgi:hypothetical protein
MQITQPFDDPRQHKPDMTLQVAAEESKVGRVAVGGIEVQRVEVGQVEVEVQETTVLVMVQRLYDEVRTVVTCDEVLNSQTSFALEIAQRRLGYLLHNTWHHTVILGNKRGIEVFRDTVTSNGIMCVGPFEFELSRLVVLLSEYTHGR